MTFEMTCSSPCDTPSDDSLDTVTDEELMQSWHLHRCQRCFEAWAMRVWKDPGYKAVASRVQVNWEKIDVSELRQKAIYELWDRPREIRFVKSYFRQMLLWAAYRENEVRKRHQSALGEENDEILANVQEAPPITEDPRTEDLKECIDKLRPTDLRLTKARYYDAEPLSNLARDLNKSMDALYQQLARIRKLLMQCLEG